MKKLVFSFAFASALSLLADTNYVATALAPFVADGRLPGAISYLYDNGREEVTCAGYADQAAKRPITLDDAFMQCSQTKGFCGVTVAMLVEEGKLNLDDPVSKYLPEFKTLWVEQPIGSDDTRILVKAKTPLTVRMCLNHTGGFPFECSAKQKDLPGGGWTGGCRVRIVASVAAHSPLLFEPGTKTQYSNTGIDIGAAVVETIVGKRWEDFLKERVLDPLDMKATWFWPTEAQLKTKIELYHIATNAAPELVPCDGWEQTPYNDDHVFASAGAGLWTTARDQLKFYKMLMNLGVGDNGVRILKEETVRNLLAVSTRPEALGGYSLGLNAPVKDGEDEWFGHGGAWGTNCMVNWHRKQLKLWVVQNRGRWQARDWLTPYNRALDAFFKAKIDTSGVDAYTGRTK